MGHLIINTKKYGDIKVLLDDCDIEIARAYKLYVFNVKSTDSFYVQTSCRKYLHRIITGAGAGQVVDHLNHNTLDNRRCNLRVGSNSDNALNSKKAFTDTQKLSELQVREVLVSSDSNNKLAKKFNVSNCLISKIKTGEMYSNYCLDIERRDKILDVFSQNRRPMFERIAIKRELLSGNRVKDIADKWKIATAELYNIKNGKKRKGVKSE